MTLKQKFLLLLIVIVAVFFRLYLISSMPGGLFPDMAANGLDINLMQQGQLQPFYERGNGREALFFYLEWASVGLFGKGVWQFSIVSALVGVLSVLFGFAATRRLFLFQKEEHKNQDQSKVIDPLTSMVPGSLKPAFNEIQGKFNLFIPSDKTAYRATNIALLSAFLMAVSSWHIVLSRTAFRASLIPLFASLSVYFLLRTYQAIYFKSRLWFAFLAGASFAAGFYTYIAFRIMVLIVIMAVIWPLLAQLKNHRFTQSIKEFFWPSVSFIVAFCLFFAPLAHYFFTHPGSFLGRSGQVSVFNPDLYLVEGVQLKLDKSPPAIAYIVAVEVAKQSLSGFFISGDLNWRHNISGQPLLSQLISPFFAVGLALITLMALIYFFSPNKRSYWWKYFLLAGWFWGMLLPVVTTAEGIPHGLRSIGMIPPVFIFSAWALYRAGELIADYHKRLWHRCEKCHEQHFGSVWFMFKKTLANIGLKLVVVCFFAALIFQSYILYFIYAFNSPENFYYFRSDLTVVSDYLKSRCDKSGTYLVLDKFSVQTTDYLTSDRYGNFSDKCNVPYRQVDPENSWQLSGLKPGDEIVFTQSSIFDVKKFKQYHPNARLKLEKRNKFSQAVLGVYEIIY